MTCLLFIFECKSWWTRPPIPLRAAFRQTADIATEAPWPHLIKVTAYYGFLGVWTKARRQCLLRIGNSLKSDEEIMTAFQESDGYTGNRNELGEFWINNFFLNDRFLLQPKHHVYEILVSIGLGFSLHATELSLRQGMERKTPPVRCCGGYHSPPDKGRV